METSQSLCPEIERQSRRKKWRISDLEIELNVRGNGILSEFVTFYNFKRVKEVHKRKKTRKKTISFAK